MKSVVYHKNPYLVLLDIRKSQVKTLDILNHKNLLKNNKTLLPVSENLLRPRFAEKVKENLHYRKGRETNTTARVARNCHNYTKGTMNCGTSLCWLQLDL